MPLSTSQARRTISSSKQLPDKFRRNTKLLTVRVSFHRTILNKEAPRTDKDSAPPSTSGIIMKLSIASVAIGTLLLQAVSAANDYSCAPSNDVKGQDIVGLKGVVQAYGGNYRISGRGSSNFATYGTAKLTMRRTSGIPTGSTHVRAQKVADKIQDIIQCCYDKGFTKCVGNGDVIGDQGDIINVNVARN